jgi:hypothetical protein
MLRNIVKSSNTRNLVSSLVRGIVKTTGTTDPYDISWLSNDAFKVNGTSPTLALCFKKNRYVVGGVGKLLTELGTYTRSYAGGTNAGSATIINSSGYIASTPVDVIRQRHNPVTNALEGIYLEGQTGNTIRASEDGNAASWVASGGTKANDAAVVNPTGGTGAWYFQEDATTGNHEMQIATNAAANGGNSMSCFIKAKGRTEVRLTFWNNTIGDYAWAILNLTTGAITSTGGAHIRGTPFVIPFKDGWFRLCVSGQATSAKTENLRIRVINAGSQSYTGDNASGVYIWGAMNQEGSLINTSYIRSFNSAGSITKGADTFTLPDISSWYATEGTLVARFYVDQTGLALTRAGVSIDDGTTANSITLSLLDNASDALGADVVNTSSSIFSNSIGTLVQGNDAIIAVALKTNDMLAAANETYGSLDTAGTIPALTRMLLGNSATASTNGFITLRDVLFYPRRLTPTELLSVTSSLSFADMDAV